MSSVKGRNRVVMGICGVALGLSLVVVDATLLATSGQVAMIPVLQRYSPVGALISVMFTGALGGGYLFGTAYVKDSPLEATIYFIVWACCSFLSFESALVVGAVPALYAGSSHVVGGLSLAICRAMQSNVGIDGVVIKTMVAGSFLNLLYFTVVVLA